MYKSKLLILKKDFLDIVRDRKVVLIYFLGCFYIPILNGLGEQSLELTQVLLPSYLVLVALCFGQLMTYLMDEEIHSKIIEIYLLEKRFLRKLAYYKILLVIILASVLITVNIILNNVLVDMSILSDVVIEYSMVHLILLLSIVHLSSVVSMHETFWVKNAYARFLNLMLMISLIVLVYGSIYYLGRGISTLLFILVGYLLYLLIPLSIRFSMKQRGYVKKPIKHMKNESSPNSALRNASLCYLLYDTKKVMQIMFQFMLFVFGLLVVPLKVLAVLLPIIVVTLQTPISHGPLLSILVENNLLKMNEIMIVSNISKKQYRYNMVQPLAVIDMTLLALGSLVVFVVTRNVAFFISYTITSLISLIVSYALIITLGERIKYNREKVVLSIIIKVVLIILNYVLILRFS